MRSLYVLQGLVNNHVYSLAAAGDRIAAGTLGGLSLLDGDAVSVNYTTANSGLKHNWISALARVGDEWFAGTYGAGVMRLDSSGHWSVDDAGRIRSESERDGAVGRICICGFARQGHMGLFRRAGRWRNVTEGLPSLNVRRWRWANGYVYAGNG